jgi:hypothetical protein
MPLLPDVRTPHAGCRSENGFCSIGLVPTDVAMLATAIGIKLGLSDLLT